MKKSVKIVLSFILAFSCLIGTVSVAFAVKTNAKLYEIYGDGMLFEQNETVTLSGMASSGDTVKAELYYGADLVASGVSASKTDGTFNVSFTAPKGGYKEYTINVYDNGELFRSLKDVVFGEVWLASGQSNMELNLGITVEGKQMIEKGEVGSKWLRVLSLPSYPEYNGSSENYPYEPQNDVKGARWIKGNSRDIFSFSATAFFFASKLMKDIDMPVGVLGSYLGATSIVSWLSNETLESNKAVYDYLRGRGHVLPQDQWVKELISPYATGSVNYNKKTYSLRNFKISGMIWYQGESDLNWDYGVYKECFKMMQSSYEKLFKYEKGRLPMAFTQLASYDYGDEPKLQTMNIQFADIQRSMTNVALTSILDVPLTFEASSHAIHPLCKKNVGERMAYCMEGLVYNMHSIKSVASVNSYEVKGEDVYVKFDNVGDGLVSKGNNIIGASVCGKDGIHVPADAEIVSADTIKLHSDLVKEPVSAAYAMSQYNGRSNLFSTENGECIMPVSPFDLNREITTKYWKDNGWTDCEVSKIWRNDGNERTGFYNTWEGRNATVEISPDSAFSGENGLKVTADSKVWNKFTVSPKYSHKKTYAFVNMELDFTDYGKISFKVRNNSAKELELDKVKIYYAPIIYFTPVVDGTDSLSCKIPADGKWHTITLDLNTSYLMGNKHGIAFSYKHITRVYDVQLEFEKLGKVVTEFDIDNFQFIPKTAEGDGARAKTPDRIFNKMFNKAFDLIFKLAVG